MKSKELFIRSIYLVSLFITIIGAVLKISHVDGARAVITIGIAISMVFILFSVYEVNISKQIDRNEKLMWTVGLIFISSITGFVYVFSARKRIIKNNEY